MSIYPLLRIGTRGSALALAQANLVRSYLLELYSTLAEPGAISLVCIRTTGDTILNQPLAEVGGKGLFTKEIDEALLHGQLDLAVHSVKDMQTILPAGVALAAVLKREDPRDAFLSSKASSLIELAGGATIGTSSLRRSTQLLTYRPDLRVVPLRGNIQTRIQRLAEGSVDAIILAAAGLLRLNLESQIAAMLPIHVMLPAAGQGAIGITCRVDDHHTYDMLQLLDHTPTALCIAAERTFLSVLDGNCRMPVAALAEWVGNELRNDQSQTQIKFRGLMMNSALQPLIIERYGPAADAELIGWKAGQDLLASAHHIHSRITEV